MTTTQLSPIATPGRRYTFVAAPPAVIGVAPKQLSIKRALRIGNRINNSTSGASLFVNLNGKLAEKGIITKTNDYTVTKDDNVILLDGSSNTVTATLLTAVGLEGKEFAIKCINGSFNCDIATTGSEEIDGDSTNFDLILHESVRVISDNANWWII